MYSLDEVKSVDPEIASCIVKEEERQNSHIELIASENWVSKAVMAAMGSPLTNKYAEGYPGKRYYGGCEYVDVVEMLAIERAKKLFGCDYVNVQPHSGAQANFAVQFAVCEPGDTIMGMNLDHGGHLTHGSPVNVSGKYFNIVPYGVDDNGFLDYDKLFVLADIKQVRRLNGWEKDQVSGFELLVDNYDDLDQVAEDLYFDLVEKQDRNGNTYFVRSIKEMNPMIFNWLDVLDVNVVVILVLIFAVAGFTMISGLLIIILERTNMIGILKALGENNTSIRKVFLYISFFLIGKGMLWGNVIGIAICLIQSHFHLITLDPSTYYLDAVPIDLNILSLVLLNIGTLCASMLMMLGPSYLITKIDPAKSIRFE